jgi:alpha-ketoglutarate-dependent sulfate ester dioxygenase
MSAAERTIVINRLSAELGAEVVGLDADRILNDGALPNLLWDALREHGVLLLKDVGFDTQSQVAFARRLGELDLSSGENYGEPGIMRVSMDPAKNGGQETIKGTFNWHMDGATLPPGRYPAPTTILTCVEVSQIGGRTSFASTRNYFASLSPAEQERLRKLRVIHSVAGSRYRVIESPTPEQEEAWAKMGRREHPLVWEHREGRPSLIIGGTSENIVGMERADGVAFLDDLVERVTTSEQVYTHEWSVGDTVMWDNQGLLHCVEPYEEGSRREMIRSTLLGVEPTE